MVFLVCGYMCGVRFLWFGTFWVFARLGFFVAGESKDVCIFFVFIQVC